jgi:hypothetical protein
MGGHAITPFFDPTIHPKAIIRIASSLSLGIFRTGFTRSKMLLRSSKNS